MSASKFKQDKTKAQQGGFEWRRTPWLLEVSLKRQFFDSLNRSIINQGFDPDCHIYHIHKRGSTNLDKTACGTINLDNPVMRQFNPFSPNYKLAERF